MSVKSVVTALQAVHRSIPGVKHAPDAMPTNLHAADLPFVFTHPGSTLEGRGWVPSMGWHETRRTYHVTAYVRILGTGTGVDEGYQETLTLLQRFGETYMQPAMRNLGGLVAHLGPDIQDSGWRADWQWTAGEDAPFYHGFRFSIEIVEKVSTA